MAENFYISGGMQKAAIEMYNNARKWEKAYKLANSFLSPEESTRLFSELAQELEEQNHIEDAEKLYTLLGEPDMAISMYKKQQQYDNMIKLVKIHHPDLLTETYSHLAKELESNGHHREAEKYYLEAKDWKSPVNMYRASDMWQEAYRVAKSHGGPPAAKQLLYLWAKNLGGEAAVKILTKHGLLEFAIDNAIESTAFDFAFTLARIASKDRVPDVHLQYAMHLEDEGKFQEAEVNFVKAGKPKEAVLMYVHNRDWDDAQRIADAHDPESINDILIGQAEAAFDKKEYAKAESLLLRAQKADIAVKFYKANGMWADAIRVCREYLPHKLQQLQEECDREGGAVGGSENIDFVLKQAREWEGTGSFAQAVDCYLLVNNSQTTDVNVLEKSWLKAAELALKFLGDVKSVEVAKLVGARLAEIKKSNSAAQVFISVGLNKEAIDVLISGSDWNKARKIAKELEPRLESYVEDKYKDFLKNEGKIDQLMNVDALAALELYAQKGEWRKCVEMAEKQNSKVLHKYLALYAAELIKNNRTADALKLYSKHGAPAFPQNFNIYVRIAADIFKLPDLDSPQAYKIWAELRDMLFDLSKNLEISNEIGATRKEEIMTLLLISHYYATRSACLAEKTLDKIATKLCISLLRHSDVIPADKAYYEAGIAAKNVGWENMAFVILNRYLDLCEAIEEGSLNTLDNTDFQDTDIPFDVPLPEKLYVDEQRHEEIKEWVLAISMDQKIEQMLPVDERMTFEASLVAVETNERSPPCVISGYPVFKNKIEFKNPHKVANKEDWNKFLMATKMSKSEECEDVLRFINDWCGISPSLAYSFQ